jgi:hypothetical protein
MILYLLVSNWIGFTVLTLNRIMHFTTQLNVNGDPGLPGGDPDLPEAPLDSGIYVLLFIVLIYGIYKIKSQQSEARQ